MTNLIPSTVFDNHELTKAGIWAPRVWNPVSNMLTGYLGDSGWQTVATHGGFTNGWSDLGGTPGTASFRVRDGILFCRGAIKGGTVGFTSSTAFTLPSGYRPTGQTILITASGTAASPTGFARIDVNADGTVNVVILGTGGANTYIDLAAIRIPVAGALLTPTTDEAFAWPMTSSPLPDGTVANAAQWYKALIGPINRTKNFLDADDTGVIPVFGALFNSWVNFGGTLPVFSYRKRRGVVWTSGTIKAGAIASIAQFGEGFKPAETRMFLQPANVTGSGIGTARVQIDATGLLSLVGYGYSGNNGYVSLDGMCWDAAT